MTEAPQHLLPWQIVTAPAGSFRTVREDGVVRARGIRYAEAQRFAAPAPFAYPQTGPQHPFPADTPAPACPQHHRDTDERLIALGFDEHCQRLSITRPDDDRTGLPVLIWIHGGSYTGGAGDLPHYDPRWLVREQEVIVVSVTYRLGLFGYLGDGGSREANAGLLDQLEALRWTHRNIAAFGGDPRNITVAGQSAGGHAAWDLLVAADAQGPAAGMIRRAIVQSAPLGIVHGRTQRVWEALAPSAEQTERMLTETPEQIAARESGINRLALRRGAAKFMPFSTRYGADPLPPEDRLEQRWRRAAGSVDLLIGTTAREVGLFTGILPPLQRLGGTRWGSRGVVEPLVRALTRRIYAKDARRWARRFREAGGRVGLYRFEYGRPGHPLACCHLSELPLLFPHPAWRTGQEEAGAGVTGPQLMASYDPDTLEQAGRELRARWGAVLHGADPAELAEIPGVLRMLPVDGRQG